MVNSLVTDNESGFIGLGSDIKGAGRRVTWNLSGSFDLDALDCMMVEVGLPDSFPRPGLPTPKEALGLAMRDMHGVRRLVRPLEGKKGWAVVSENARGDALDHEVKLTAKVNAIGVVTFNPPDHPQAARLKQLYEDNLQGIGATHTSTWLASTVMPYLDAIRLDPSGGDYYVPPGRVEEFLQIKRALSRVSSHRLHGMPVVQCEEAIEVLLDGLAEQFASECNQLLNELNDLGERALETRKTKLAALRDKVARYEAVLGTKMPALHEQAEEADGILVAALLAAAPQMKEAVR